MGISRNSIGFITKMTKGQLAGKRVLELGDQKLHVEVKCGNFGERVWAKDWFEEKGSHHYTIDWHGKNGAHPIDLSKPVRDRFWLGRFDIVTNFGTAEHVENQYNCWRNIHNFCKVGGMFLHFLPVDWPPEHCNYLYSSKFLENLLRSNDYKLISAQIYNGTLTPSNNPCRSIHAAFCKPNYGVEFMPDEKEFMSWIKLQKKDI